jgi:hypothetical protein
VKLFYDCLNNVIDNKNSSQDQKFNSIYLLYNFQDFRIYLIITKKFKTNPKGIKNNHGILIYNIIVSSVSLIVQIFYENSIKNSLVTSQIIIFRYINLMKI